MIDIAEAAVVIEPLSLLDDDVLSGDVEIQFGLPADIAEVFELLGGIRHMTRTPEGSVHLGIEFRSLTVLDVMLLDLIRRDLDAFT